MEAAVGDFYVYTLWAGPALLGYALGRWAPVLVRALPIPFIVIAGYFWTYHSDHGFSDYVLGNLVYAGFCAGGLRRHAEDRKVAFWSLHHYDWILIAAATLLMKLAYIRPEL